MKLSIKTVVRIFIGSCFGLLCIGGPAYSANIPEDVTFLEGQPAKDKWHEMRNAWLEAHGYEPRSPEDWNPMEAPVAAPKVTAERKP